MKYGEAFSKLGYQLVVPRQDWTAEKENGVCITAWKNNIDYSNWTFDTRVHAKDWEEWGSKSGNKKRIRHATRALSDFHGWVDVVIVDGLPGEGVAKADPWIEKDRKGKRWCVTYLEEETGHIRLELLD
jgi:hypothetical protein